MNFKIFRKKGPILVKRSTIKKEGKAQVTFKNDEFWGYSLIKGQFRWSEGAIILTKDGIEQTIKIQNESEFLHQIGG